MTPLQLTLPSLPAAAEESDKEMKDVFLIRRFATGLFRKFLEPKPQAHEIVLAILCDPFGMG